jgi:hypothetical protein
MKKSVVCMIFSGALLLIPAISICSELMSLRDALEKNDYDAFRKMNKTERVEFLEKQLYSGVKDDIKARIIHELCLYYDHLGEYDKALYMLKNAASDLSISQEERDFARKWIGRMEEKKLAHAQGGQEKSTTTSVRQTKIDQSPSNTSKMINAASTNQKTLDVKRTEHSDQDLLKYEWPLHHAPSIQDRITTYTRYIPGIKLNNIDTWVTSDFVTSTTAEVVKEFEARHVPGNAYTDELLKRYQAFHILHRAYLETGEKDTAKFIAQKYWDYMDKVARNFTQDPDVVCQAKGYCFEALDWLGQEKQAKELMQQWGFDEYDNFKKYSPLTDKCKYENYISYLMKKSQGLLAFDSKPDLALQYCDRVAKEIESWESKYPELNNLPEVDKRYGEEKWYGWSGTDKKSLRKVLQFRAFRNQLTRAKADYMKGNHEESLADYIKAKRMLDNLPNIPNGVIESDRERSSYERWIENGLTELGVKVDRNSGSEEASPKPASSSPGGCGGCGSAQATTATQPAANPAESSVSGGGCGCGSAQPSKQSSASSGGCGGCGSDQPATGTHPAAKPAGSSASSSGCGCGSPQPAAKPVESAGGCGCGSAQAGKQSAASSGGCGGCGSTEASPKPAESSAGGGGCGCGSPTPREAVGQPAPRPGAAAR